MNTTPYEVLQESVQRIVGAGPVHVHHLPKRLWRRITDSAQHPGCWIWVSPLDANGYGQLKLGHRRGPAHRLIYELAHGTVPRELVMDHLCRVPRCVNPAHLEPVTNRENLRRGVGTVFDPNRERRGRKGDPDFCRNGHPVNEENTHIQRDGSRHCRVCDADRKRTYYWRAKATA